MSGGGGGGQTDTQRELESEQLTALKRATQEERRLKRVERRQVRELRRGSLGLRSLVFRDPGREPRTPQQRTDARNRRADAAQQAARRTRRSTRGPVLPGDTGQGRR